MTLTVELPEDVAKKVLARPEKERQNFAVTVMRRGIALTDEEAERAEIRAAIEEADADIAAGRFLTRDDMLAESRSYWQERGIDFDAAFARAKPVAEK